MLRRMYLKWSDNKNFKYQIVSEHKGDEAGIKSTTLKIEGSQELANSTHFATVMGLLLWPVFSNDHIQLNMQSHGGFKKFFKKIRHTIEDML